MELYNEGLRVALGDIDDPETYRRMQVNRAALVVAIKTDGVLSINPDPQMSLKENTELILIGTYDAESKVIRLFFD